jgi:hypothetical protein
MEGQQAVETTHVEQDDAAKKREAKNAYERARRKRKAAEAAKQRGHDRLVAKMAREQKRKPAAKKAAKRGGEGATGMIYRLTAKGRKFAEEHKGTQLAKVLHAVEKAAPAATSAAVRKLAHIDTESEAPARIVAFYLSKAKKEGLISGHR